MGMWIQKVPMWKEMENWRARRQAVNDQLDTMAALTNNLQFAGANYYSTLANLGAEAALKRVQAAGKAKAAEKAEIAAKEAAAQKEADAVAERLKIPPYIRIMAKGVNFKV